MPSRQRTRQKVGVSRQIGANLAQPPELLIKASPVRRLQLADPLPDVVMTVVIDIVIKVSITYRKFAIQRPFFSLKRIRHPGGIMLQVRTIYPECNARRSIRCDSSAPRGAAQPHRRFAAAKCSFSNRNGA